MQRCAGRLADVIVPAKDVGLHCANRLTAQRSYISTHKVCAELKKRLTVSCASERQGAEVTTIRSQPAGPVAKGDPERSRFSGANEEQGQSFKEEEANIWQLEGAISRGEWKRAVSIVDALVSLVDDVNVEDISAFITGVPSRMNSRDSNSR